MKPTFLQKNLLGLGIACVLSCGCASPFRPNGWVCYEMKWVAPQSLEYCSYQVDRPYVNNESDTHFNGGVEWQADPFLVTEE